MNYIICTTGRARSSVLMFYLKQLDAGYPDEYLNEWFNRKRDIYDLDDVCRFIQKRNNDGFGAMRTTFTGLMRICNIHKITIKQLFDKALPNAKYIYFTRNNLRQIVESLYYEQVQMFDDLPRVLPRKDIEKTLIHYATEETCWELFFEKYNIDPLRITCENLVKHRDYTLKEVCSFIGKTYPENINLRDRTNDALTNHDQVESWYQETMKRYINLLQ